MPGGAGMPESTFKAFDSQSFARFQRKNKKVTEFLLEGKSNPRYELMMKMVSIKMQRVTSENASLYCKVFTSLLAPKDVGFKYDAIIK